MDPGIFEFQTMMTTVANGMSGKMIPAIVNVAYIFMIISLMLGVYEAYARGGDTKGLAGTVMKFIVVAFIIGNWTTFFADLNSGFNTIAQQIDNSYGAGDLLKDWGALLTTNWNNSGLTLPSESVPLTWLLVRSSRWLWESWKALFAFLLFHSHFGGAFNLQSQPGRSSSFVHSRSDLRSSVSSVAVSGYTRAANR